MITSSSRRIIKRPDLSDNVVVENYMPPLEQILAARDLTPKAAVFPRYTMDGKKKDEEKPALEQTPPQSGLEEEHSHLAPETESREETKEQTEKLLDEWKEEGARLLEEARQEAARILEDSRKQAEEERTRAYEEGRREGYEAGYEEGEAKADEKFQEQIRSQLLAFQVDMKQALKSVETAKERCVHMYLEELKDCAIAIGEKVIHVSLRSSGEVIKQMIISATEKLKKTAWVKIYIDKYDYDMMMEADAGVIDELSHLSDNIKFVVMDKEERGSCIIERPEEIVDVSVNTQIENIKEILEHVRI